MQSMSSQVTVVIPTFQAENCIDDCLQSVLRVVEPVRTIVIDNASTDSITVIKNRTNLGFGAACNIGVSAATTKYVLLLNQDAILVSDVDSAVRILETVTWVGAVGGMMVSASGRVRSNALRYPRLSNVLLKRLSHDERALSRLRQGAPLISVEYFEFSLALVRRRNYAELTGFDERYFLYGEERDFVRRMNKIGLSAVLSSSIKFVHDGGYDSTRRQLVLEGQLRFVDDHCHGLQKVVFTLLLNLKAAIANSRWSTRQVPEKFRRG